MLRKRLHIRLLGSLLAAASVMAFASPASAGTYDVNSCTKSPSHSIAGWSTETTVGTGSTGTPYFYYSTNCYTYGRYRRFETGTVAAGATAAFTFAAPDGTWIDNATLYQTITPRSSGAYDSVIAELEDGTKRTLATYIGGTGTVQGDHLYGMPFTGPHTVRLRTELGCQMPTNCSGLSGSEYGNVWELRGAVIALQDPSTPAFGSVSGGGWKTAPADGVLPIDYELADQGSGISSVRFLVDGIQHAVNAEACSAGRPVPCPLSSTGQFVLDTTRLSEGTHTAALVAADYSGNENTDKRLTFTVRRAPTLSDSTPVSTTDPAASGGGSPATGDQIHGGTGDWAGADLSFAYQWMRCDVDGLNCAPIAGATGVDYTVGADDVGHTLVFCVTASNSGGSTTRCSAPTPVVVTAHPSSATTADRPGSTVITESNTSTSSTTVIDRGSPNGHGASDRVVLTALANSKSSKRKVRFGKRTRITGRLLGPGGTPITGAVLSVQVQKALPGAAMADVSKVATDSDGRFTYIAPKGPSRLIRFGYRSYSADSSFADTTDVTLLVKAGVTMRARPTKVRNRHSTTFTGRLLGRPIPRRGVVVDLQVFFRRHWRTFAAPRTNRRGVYKYRYRFMAGAATWRFRARVRRETSYPFILGYSRRPVKVRVVD